YMPKAAHNFSSSSGRKSWFKEPPKESWWSEPPKKPNAAVQFAENLIIGVLCVAPIGYCLTLPAVTDSLKAEMKKLDIFGVEKLRGELEEHIRESQKPGESLDHPECLSSASKIVSDNAGGRNQPSDTKLPSSEDHLSLLSATAKARDAEKQEEKRKWLARTRTPNPNSKDPGERLAAYWKDPKNKAELREWWNRLSFAEQLKYSNVTRELRYQFGVDWPNGNSNPFK
ncbi:MAG: hypothetical protein L6R38_007032, partial [Xanthoria sp. 2 TBL-2021]